MTFSKYIATVFLFVVVWSHGAFAQSRHIVGGLSDNTEYKELIETQRRLCAKDDSLSTLLDRLREEFRQNPQNRSKRSVMILELEGSQFDVRNQIGMVTGRISMIEQDYVLKSLEAGITPQIDNRPSQPQSSQGKVVPDFVKNDYFRRNLKPEDYRQLLESQAAESAMAGYIARYRDNYKLLTAIESRYPREKDEVAADSLYAEYMRLTQLNRSIADSADAAWRQVSDNKLYVYSYLLEKMNRMDVLAQVQTSVEQERGIETENAGKYSSDAIAFYTFRKSLMLDIEMKMAEILALDKSKDSLSKAHAAVNSVSYAYEPIDIEEKLFIDFIPVSVSPGKYNAGNPIPAMEIYDKGVIYRIQVGTYFRPAAISGFRGLYPLTYHIGDDGKYRYYAGCYDDLDQAVAGLKTVNAAGFKDAFIVVWERGVTRNIGNGAFAAKASEAGQFYRVEINSGGKALPPVIQDIISNSGKDLTKVGNTIIVATFDSQLDAEKLMAEIRDISPELDVSTVAIAE